MKRSLKKKQRVGSLPATILSKESNFRESLQAQQVNNTPTRVGVVEEFRASREYNGPKPPKFISDAATMRGGLNNLGEPMYRLVWAPDRLSPVGGTWTDWPEGMSLQERTNAWKTGAKPIRRTVEVRLKKRYLTAGDLWALERYQPAERYGSRQRWYSPIHFGGTMVYVPWKNVMVPSLGAYPDQGDYEYTNFGFTNEELSEAAVLTSIGMIERYVSELPSLAVRVHNTVVAAQVEEELRDAQVDAMAKDILNEYSPAFGGNPMAGYGKKKRHSSIDVAERLGIRSHPNAS